MFDLAQLKKKLQIKTEVFSENSKERDETLIRETGPESKSPLGTGTKTWLRDESLYNSDTTVSKAKV